MLKKKKLSMEELIDLKKEIEERIKESEKTEVKVPNTVTFTEDQLTEFIRKIQVPIQTKVEKPKVQVSLDEILQEPINTESKDKVDSAVRELFN